MSKNKEILRSLCSLRKGELRPFSEPARVKTFRWASPSENVQAGGAKSLVKELLRSLYSLRKGNYQPFSERSEESREGDSSVAMLPQKMVGSTGDTSFAKFLQKMDGCTGDPSFAKSPLKLDLRPSLKYLNPRISDRNNIRIPMTDP